MDWELWLLAALTVVEVWVCWRRVGRQAEPRPANRTRLVYRPAPDILHLSDTGLFAGRCGGQSVYRIWFN